MEFGDYLKEKGLITPEQLKAAREHYQLSRIPLGKLGVEQGYFSRKDNIAVMLEKRKSEGKRYGQVAKELGILDEEKLNTLLKLQKMENSTLNDSLIDLGILPKKEVITNRVMFERLKKNGELKNEG